MNSNRVYEVIVNFGITYLDLLYCMTILPIFQSSNSERNFWFSPSYHASVRFYWKLWIKHRRNQGFGGLEKLYSFNHGILVLHQDRVNCPRNNIFLCGIFRARNQSSILILVLCNLTLPPKYSVYICTAGRLLFNKTAPTAPCPNVVIRWGEC